MPKTAKTTAKLPLYSEQSSNKDFFVVEFDSRRGTYNLLSVIDLARQFGFKSRVQTIDDEDLADDADAAEHFVNRQCAKNITFTCTENSDWVFCHVRHQVLFQ